MLPDRRAWIEDPELQEQERLLQCLFARDERLIFFDVGACEGESSVRYARLFPTATVYAAEPLPANAALVRRAVTDWDVPHVVRSRSAWRTAPAG